MRTSAAGIALIKHFEGVIPYAYTDPAGHATFGVGHLIHKGPVTRADQERWGTKSRPKSGLVTQTLRSDLREFEDRVSHLVRGAKRGTKQHQFDGMVCLAFNIGLGAFEDSTVLRMHRAGRSYRAGLAFLLWTRAGGTTLLGLVRRRRAERKLYRKGRWS